MRIWDESYILPAMWRAKEENGNGKKRKGEKNGRKGEKSALGPGGRAKSTRPVPYTPNTRSAFNKCIGVKKKKKKGCAPAIIGEIGNQ